MPTVTLSNLQVEEEPLILGGNPNAIQLSADIIINTDEKSEQQYFYEVRNSQNEIIAMQIHPQDHKIKPNTKVKFKIGINQPSKNAYFPDGNYLLNAWSVSTWTGRRFDWKQPLANLGHTGIKEWNKSSNVASISEKVSRIGTGFDRTRGQQTEPKEQVIVSGTKPFEKPPRQRVFQSVKDIEEAYDGIGLKYGFPIFLPLASAEEQQEITEVQQQLGSFGLSQETQNIIDDWATKKIIIPSWFVNNNMQWVLEGKISEQEFLAGYQNLVNTGIITYSEEPEPEPEPTETWWVTKPSGIIEQMTVTQKFIDKMTAQGWIFSKEPPTITQPENEDISVIFFVGTGGDLKTHFKFSSLIVGKDIQQELAKWINKNYGTTILTTFNNYTDNPITHNLEDIKNLIKQKIQDDEPDKPDPDPEEILPNANMVRQEIGRFQVVNKILKGKVTYIATDSFNEHFYYNFENNSGEILKCYVIATDSSGNVLLSKQNDLRFSETERDETIIINDYVDTEENKITVEFYVTNTPTQDSFEDDFAFVRTITTPYFPKKPDTLFGALYGLIAIPTALTLLGRKT